MFPSPPIFTIPDDLMYDILVDVCKDDDTRPLELSLVCKRWRNAVLDASILWSNIEFNSPPPYHIQERRLQRSKSAPLTITILPQFQSGMGMRAIASIIKLLRPHVHRFRSLDIGYMKRKGVRTFFDELGRFKAPILTNLTVRAPVDSKKWTLKPFGGHATGLLTLHIAWGRTNWHPSLLCNLTSLSLAVSSWNSSWNITLFDILKILTQTPCLKTLGLQFRRNAIQTGEPWNSSPVKLEFLSAIHFSTLIHTFNTMEPWMLSLLCAIIAPNLRSFPCNIHPPCIMTLNDCATFPLPGLRDLQMMPDPDGVNISRDSFPAFLKNVHQLERLCVIGDQLTKPAIQHLSTQLNYLKVLLIRGNPLSLEGLKNLVVARINNPDLSALKTLMMGRTYYQEKNWPSDLEVEWFKAHVDDFQCDLQGHQVGVEVLPVASRVYMT